MVHLVTFNVVVDATAGVSRVKSYKKLPFAVFLFLSLFRASCGDSTEAEELDKRPPGSYIPSHWSSMPPCEQYTHISLLTFSKEFKEVEQLFRKWMGNDMEIEKISRVQNPFLWETYCR